ncbi:hypothetical protein GYH30_047708 [Glycine max]|uniref:Uncharacterized protein n=2 Tax=Glycine subgen. Soja TaxID=1462606 RepID=K7MMD7_SOYBN|nr:hypothetical protein GYH30_047708 [Glycine max]RZB57483.1 T-complex protein 1 subunit theta [Glycine soja]
MLKEGHKHLFGLHEVVLKNIDAYKQVSTITRTSFNPNGTKIISGYTKAINKTIQILDELVEDGFENMDVRDKEQVISRMKAVVANKQFGQEDIICSLACIQVCPKNLVNFKEVSTFCLTHFIFP